MKGSKAIILALLLVFFQNIQIKLVYSEDCSYILKRSLSIVQDIRDYSAIVETYNRLGNKEDQRVYDYKYLAPGYIRMKVIEGTNKGGEVFYDPKAKTVKGCKKIVVKVCKTFNPNAPEVKSIRGVKVYETTFYSILKETQGYLDKAYCSVKTEGSYNVVELKLKEKAGDVDTIVVKISRSNNLPIVWEKFGNGTLLYKLTINNLKLNTGIKLEDLVL